MNQSNVDRSNASISPTDTIGQIVRLNPSTSRVFEQHNIDYCCGGKSPLAEVCEEHEMDAADLIKELVSSRDTEDGARMDVAAMSMTELADHIENTHHVYLKRELPRLKALAAKVAAAHGKRDEKLFRIQEIVDATVFELSSHLIKEEKVLFPMIRRMEKTSTDSWVDNSSVQAPIGRMEHEHDDVGQALEELAQITNNYTPPDWACNTYRALLDALKTFQADMHQHVHKENNILFVRATAEESRQRAVHIPWPAFFPRRFRSRKNLRDTGMP